MMGTPICKNLRKIEKFSCDGVYTKNMLIHGDNNKVLDLLGARFSRGIKCIYIDPPYNNGETYEHYHDDKDHEVWINDLSDTLERLKNFLTDDGSLWISIDDREMHYLKVAADKIFGRGNFLTTIIWQQRSTRENRNIFSNNHEYILVYCKNPTLFKRSRNLLPQKSDILKRYKNPDSDCRGPWQSISANVQAGHATKNQFYNIVAPNGQVHSPPRGRCWVYNKQRMTQEIINNKIWFGREGGGVPRIKKYLSDSVLGVTPETLWLSSEVSTNKMAKKHLLELLPNKTVFDTPKPEQLIKRILEIATNEGDIVLDAFLGSGSTAAVAHKMNRNYIGIEISEKTIQYAASRIKKVISGEQGGISKEIKWEGGGHFDFYKHIEIV